MHTQTHSQLESLWQAGGWLHIPYSAVKRIDPALWLDLQKVHCGDEAKQAAKVGCFARGIVVVGRDTAKRTIKGYEKLVKDAKRNGVTKTILRARLSSLQFATKYFAPKLP